MSPRNQFGDTTYTKVFVGGLPWETQKETMKNYFDQFGHILEAVVITDKNTGRSKGYGFVTFSEPEAAMRACADPAPVIDGRRANCNLAFFGVQKSTPTTPQNGSNGGMNRAMKSFAAGSGTPTVFPQPAIAAGLPHYTAAIQPHISSYHLYGYHPYTAEYNYPSNYYSMYGGGVATAQYPQIYGAGAVAAANGAYYPYFQIGQQGATGTGATAYGHAPGYPSNFQGYNSMQYPHMFQYPSSTTVTGFGQQYYGASGASMALAPAATPQPGMTGMAVAATTAAANPYGLLSTTPSPSSAFE